jgi:hypothetical protein
MTAKELFELNGDGVSSPLIRTARRLHDLFEALGVPYAIIGGVAVARHGAFRTTHDLDVLVPAEGWARVRQSGRQELEFLPTGAKDRVSGVHVDVLHPGDEWEMLIPLPTPDAVSEFDQQIGARFMDLAHLLELKCAVYLAKRRDDGIEVAAKDLADVVALVKANEQSIDPSMIRNFHPRIRREVERIRRRVRKSLQRKKQAR